MTARSRLKLLAVLADHTRLRILAVLRDQPLAVAEIQEILHTGQSRISTHLSQLRAAGLVEARREGQRAFYQWAPDLAEAERSLLAVALEAAAEIPAARNDQRALRLVLDKRRRRAEAYFNTLAGRLGKRYCPGRSWEAVGHLLLQMTPPLVIADLGAGEGLLSQLLAPRARRIIAIDRSPRMVKVGGELARKNGLDNLEFRLGTMEAPPLPAASVDLVILSQALHHSDAPAKTLQAAHRLLRKGGRILILDLNQHDFEQARELYADTWLGFAEADLRDLLRQAGFKDVTVSLVSREPDPPHFQTLLATGSR